jgi:hypothetical protein
MRYPDGYLWEYPGFPSLTISYLKTNDFFFSGHVGFPIIIAMECYNLKKLCIMIFCLFTCVVEFITMIFTRGHYFIDLITGVIVSHYTYIIVEKYIHYIDDSCIGMKKSESRNDKDGFQPVEIKSDHYHV